MSGHEVSHGSASSDSMALMNMESLTLKSKASLDPPASLLSIPLELRLMIYEEIFGDLMYFFGDYCISDCSNFGVCFDYHFPMAILRTCKQLHREVAPFLYKKISIVRPINGYYGWIPFFKEIGPRNGALIQDISIEYKCLEQHFKNWWYCNGRKDEYKTKLYEELFESMACANVMPKYLRIEIKACMGYNAEGERVSDTGLPFVNCHVQKDLKFLRGLCRFLEKIQEIHFHGLFNPLWAFSLRRRLGFVLKYEDFGQLYDRHWTLINPKSLEPATDLRGYRPSKSVHGVYEKITKDEEYSHLEV
ncbi:hypothetical protein M434DRAFT_10248 [Hypoxylon sp. CO27-5]|nr:hypothetical protein M434DRAFT_10248 [Hypoxylon sp. CO27-5]